MPLTNVSIRLPLRGLTWVLATVLVVTSLGCSSTRFDRSIHDPSVPRVSVIHRPLHPEVGETFRIIARPEGLQRELTAQVTLTVVYPGGNLDHTCSGLGLDPRGECVLEGPAGARRSGVALYSAVVANGPAERSSGVFSFQVGLPDPPPPGEARVFPLRVPVEQQDRMLSVLLVPDRASFAILDSVDLGRFTARVEGLLYDGLLRDPAYRWRDDQIGFYATERLGVVTAYGSGNRSRCGGNPWPGVAEAGVDLASEIAFADAIGVLHTQDFRDCAGLGTVTAAGRARSHFGANADDPHAFQHELGHALFGLGDEYREETATRQAPGGERRPGGCCCEPPGDAGGGVVGPGGVPGPGVCADPDAPVCGQLLDPACYPADPGCPPIASSCERPNVFPTRAECEDTVDMARTHPAVAPDDPVDADCRLLCSPETELCPCTPDRTVWILDRRTPDAAGVPDDDVMGELDAAAPAEHHGPACVLCIEAELCMLWELGSDRSEAAAREYCGLP